MHWLARFTMNDILQTMLTWKVQPSASQVQILTDAIAYLNDHKDLRTQELTSSEQFVSNGWDALQPVTIYLILGPTAKQASQDIKKDILALLNWLKDSQIQNEPANRCILPYWETLQHYFLLLEQLKAIDKFADTALILGKQKTHHSYNKIPAEILQKIKKAAKENASMVQGQAKDHKKRLEKTGKEEILKTLNNGDETGKALEEVVGSERMKQYTADFTESGVEALDGILRVKI